MSQGWVRLYREICEKPWYAESERVHLWVDLLLDAMHAERPVTLQATAVESRASRSKVAHV